MLRTSIFLLSLLSLSACVTDDDSVISTLHPRPNTQGEFRETIQDATKYKHVMRTFETVYKLYVTSLDPLVMESFKTKFEELFNRPQEVIEEGKTAFFVSVFAPNAKEADMSNKYEWFTSFQIGNEKHKPEKVVRLKKSKLWANFFPYVTDYSREFILYFDLSKDEKEQNSKAVKILTLSNSQAKTVIHW